MLLLLFGVACLIPWVVREHRTANRYRQLLELAKEGPNATQVLKTKGWLLVYKEGKAQKTLSLDVGTEQEAMAQATRVHQIRYDKIVSLTQR